MGGAVSSVVSAVAKPISSIVGSVANIGIGGGVQTADLSGVKGAIANANAQRSQFNQYLTQYRQQQQAALGQVNSALGILQGAASGSAPSQAQSVLQRGLDQAIQTQQAMANTGNLSSMIGNQRAALSNAAQLTQQTANEAAGLRAQEMAAARESLAAASTNALSLAQSGEANVTGQMTNLTGQAISGNTGAATIQQGANTAQGQLIAGSAGGIIGGLGSSIMKNFF